MSRPTPNLEPAYAKAAQAISYDPDTGAFHWKVQVSTRCKAGQAAGCRHKSGYVTITHLGHKFYTHRLAFYLFHKRLPNELVDHINGIKFDNRISNLRESSFSENSHNATLQKNNRSGYPGVCWSKNKQLWTATIYFDNKNRFLGNFEDKEIAYAAYLAAKKQIHSTSPAGHALPKTEKIFDPNSGPKRYKTSFWNSQHVSLESATK